MIKDYDDALMAHFEENSQDLAKGNYQMTYPILCRGFGMSTK